jgi:hypothetical protein
MFRRKLLPPYSWLFYSEEGGSRFLRNTGNSIDLFVVYLTTSSVIETILHLIILDGHYLQLNGHEWSQPEITPPPEQPESEKHDGQIITRKNSASRTQFRNEKSRHPAPQHSNTKSCQAIPHGHYTRWHLDYNIFYIYLITKSTN